ncbi:cell division protein [Francisella tularensis subsp. holarctica PHIT-FT049]|uniref:SPOR domain-containing protein n=1 Tax=Francisella tularensis TaxID=263 RepID=UPI00015D7A10|nr:SPOR domain-containing protein [Francisella tularensis]AHH46153.1 cell division protein [Francisella tularensis subsp. holarctica PHIT-FT049]ALK94757.1 cell division protein [Francisella tularensis]EDO65964.1 cell division protein [Francisella tularensis subsp. holarctica FSC022]KIP30228.1 sporulation related domain protein [Francisella tularensis subsp. holarctica]MCC9171480.1 SPOR domain-containing protein [Francisella tularensis]
MKDLSRLDIPKKTAKDNSQEPQQPKNTKKKKILITIVVCLLVVAVASKLVNKHLKKIKAEQEKAKIELQAEKNQKSKTLDNKQSSEATNHQTADLSSKDNPSNDKMVFTFYNNLKHDSVEVDVVPEAQRAQYKYTYIYQIASFRNMDETSWYVKKMKEAGLNPQFERAGNWIRMYIGPYDSKRAMAPDIIKLQRIGLNGGFPREVSRTKIEPKDNNKVSDSKSSDKDLTNNNSKS